MYKHKKVICIIPARGGSKGLPGKNIKKFVDRPLIAFSIEQALASRYIDRVIVSTDDRKIAKVSRKYGAEAPFLRPKRLAADKASTIKALLHAIAYLEKKEHYQFDILVLLHATSPLRLPEDIDRCIELLCRKNTENVFSVAAAKCNPYFNMVEIKGGKVSLVKKGNFACRQAAPRVFQINASVYAWHRQALNEKSGLFSLRSRIYLMPQQRSVDIDDQTDFRYAELLMKERLKKG